MRGAIPGERVVADLRSQKGVLMGTTLQVLEPSHDRVPASFHPGLDFSHMTYARQLVEKRAVVVDALARARRQAKAGAAPMAGAGGGGRPAPGPSAPSEGAGPHGRGRLGAGRSGPERVGVPQRYPAGDRACRPRLPQA